MSLDRHLSVMMKKAQMSSDSAGSQCGLTSLLPMSCRGRAAAFARDLNSRLRNLGTAHGDDGESSWLARPNTAHRQNATAQSDLHQFYNYDIASPPSPVNEYEPTFVESLPTDEQEQPFYDVESKEEIKEQAKLMLQQPDRKRNGFKFSAAFYDNARPVKIQPTKSSDNGHADRLYSPITFEDCLRQDSRDESDNVASPSSVDPDFINLSIPAHLSTTLDSDSEFESAKSDPSESIDEVPETVKQSTEDVAEHVDNLSLSGIDISAEEETSTEISEDVEKPDEENIENVSAETPVEVEVVLKTESSSTNDDNKPDDQDEDDRPERVRRCSSLKTGKTPPGTPGRKKIVRFADVLGLDLTDIKTFMDDVPVVPKSAYKDLAGNDIFGSSPPTQAPQRLGSLTLVPLFQLPRDCTERLERQNVCLETARVCDGVHVSICGSVRVRNLDFHKTVHVRYTMNSWKTYTDLQTNYVQGSCDGYSDRFQFTLYMPCITTGQRLELAVRFQCKGQQFWDNNKGVNYCFDCLALGVVLPPPSQSGPLHPTTDSHPSFC